MSRDAHKRGEGKAPPSFYNEDKMNDSFFFTSSSPSSRCVCGGSRTLEVSYIRPSSPNFFSFSPSISPDTQPLSPLSPPSLVKDLPSQMKNIYRTTSFSSFHSFVLRLSTHFLPFPCVCVTVLYLCIWWVVRSTASWPKDVQSLSLPRVSRGSHIRTHIHQLFFFYIGTHTYAESFALPFHGKETVEVGPSDGTAIFVIVF